MKRKLKLIESPIERDMYVNGGEYAIEDASSLKALFFDPKYKIQRGGIVQMTYIEEVLLNKGFNYVSSDLNSIEAQGRSLNKKYANDFYDSDDYKNQMFNGRKKNRSKRPMAIFVIHDQDFQWGVERYSVQKDAEDKIYSDASDTDIMDFLNNDPTAKKRLAKFIELNPDRQDEIESYLDMGTLPNDVFKEIAKTKIKNGGGGWSRIDDSDIVYRHDKTNNEGLRLTRSSKWRSGNFRFVMLMNGKLSEISREEYKHWKRAWNSDPKVKEPTPHTKIGDMLNNLKSEFLFNNYILNNIISMRFSLIDVATKQKKQINFMNNKIVLEGDGDSITVSANDLRQGGIPISENKIYKILDNTMKNKLIRLTESDLHRIVTESVKRTANKLKRLNEGAADVDVQEKWNAMVEIIGADSLIDSIYQWLSEDQLNEIIGYAVDDYDLDYSHPDIFGDGEEDFYDEDEDEEDIYDEDEEDYI